MSVWRPRTAQLGTAALVVAALSTGRVITDLLPDTNRAYRAWERHVAVGETAQLRYAAVRATRVDGARQIVPPDNNVLVSPTLWVVVDLTAVPREDNVSLSYAELRDTTGRAYPTSRRSRISCATTNPGIPTKCTAYLEVATDHLPGATLLVSRAGSDSLGDAQGRGDDAAVIDLGITPEQVTRWRAVKDPVKVGRDTPRSDGLAR
ncbi:MAG: hypothetical protein LWW86_01135 [Micrococcales bacterium]|nr:hypothetical protein [Micrococcales bacterium]